MALKQKLAELVVDITAKLDPLKSSLAKARGMMKRGLDKMVRIARRAAVAIGVAFAAGIVWAVKLAMAAQESEALFSVAMGDMADSTRKWSDQFAKSLRLNAFEVRKFVGTLNMMLKSMGLSKTEAAKMSKSMVELAYDISSAHDILPEDAFAKIRSGLVGMSRPLIELGYDLRETAVQQYALNTGMIKSGQQLTQTQKVLARYRLLLKVTRIAQGDLKRTLGSATNAFRALGARIKMTAIDIGIKLLPKITAVVEGVITWAEKNQELITSGFGKWIDAISTALKGLAPLFGKLAKYPKLLTAGLYSLILLPFLPWLKLAGNGIKWLIKGVKNTVHAFGIWRIAMRHGAGTAGVMSKTHRVLFWTLSKLVDALKLLWMGMKAILVAGKVAFAMGFLVGTAIALAATNIYLLIKAMGLLRKERKNARALTEDDIAAHKKESSGRMAAAKALHAAAKEELKDIKALTKAREELRKVMKRSRDGDAKSKEVATATKTLTDATLKAVKAVAKERQDAAKTRAKEAVAAAEKEKETDKELLEAQLAYLEKIGGEYRRIADLKHKLLAIEAKEIAEKTGADPLEVRRALAAKARSLQVEAADAAHDERITEYREKLQILKDLFTGEAKYAKDLAIIKQKLRHEEALDVKKVAPWLDLESIKAMLKAKEAPAEVARAGLSGFQASWAQVATGTKRTQEEQLRALEGIRQSVERQEEIAESGQGMQSMSTPRF